MITEKIENTHTKFWLPKLSNRKIKKKSPPKWRF
nr:MAG TPA: hypothetical protein [Caudoviricetes sp.]